MIAATTDQPTRIDRLEQLKNLMVAFSTGGSGENADYATLRAQLIADPLLSERLPTFVRNCRSLSEFWGFIKHKFGTYRERRQFIWDAFNPLINELELSASAPSDMSSSRVVGRTDRAHVQDQWEKALARRETDPPGAITAARSLLEAVCKAILHEAQVEYSDTDDLPALYRRVARQLNLSPDQHSESIFRQVLGGCHAVVEGLGAIRSKDGDAHGPSPLRRRPAPRHAQLVVNLAGATATFLIETWEEQSKGKVEELSAN